MQVSVCSVVLKCQLFLRSLSLCVYVYECAGALHCAAVIHVIQAELSLC